MLPKLGEATARKEASARWQNRDCWRRSETVTELHPSGEKSRILGEFIAVTGHHSKHGIRLLGQSGDDGEQQPTVKGPTDLRRDSS